MRERLLRWAAIAAAAFVGALIVVLTQAPARWLSPLVARASGDRLMLGDPDGTVWTGTADLVLSSGGATPLQTRLPGRFNWHLDAGQLLLGTGALRVENPALLDAPLQVQVDRSLQATIESNRLRLPASALTGLGAPWNTVKPGGELELQWDTLHVQAGTVHGALRGQWLRASSGLSPIVPFGHYRLQADGYFDGARLRLDTVTGPLEMDGDGTISNGLQVHFHGLARVQPGTDPAVATQLSGLISLLGRSKGEEAILNFGT